MSARDVATARIAEQARMFPRLLEVKPLQTEQLEPRDAALAQAIDHAVTRHWLTLAAVVQTQLSRPWDELEIKLRAVLLSGAAQLLLLERLPDHAVLNESVEWAKRNIRPKAGGLVNAVLRKVAALRAELIQPADPLTSGWALEADRMPLGDGRIWRLAAPAFDADPVRRLAQQTSHPEPLIAQWMTTFGQAATGELALHNLIQPPIIAHGVRQASASLTPHDDKGFWVFTGSHDELLELLGAEPGMIIQDPASAAPVSATEGTSAPPGLIVDVCAGRGTKTRQLAAVHPGGEIVATDIDSDRLGTLRRQFEGHPRVRIVDFAQLAEFRGQADFILLDVPCSNSGVLARRVEAKYRIDPESRKKLVDLQRQIIADALPLLGSRGRIVYSTCSIEPAENAQQAEWITKWHPFKIARSASRMPAGVPSDPPSRYSDGGYFAVLERR